MNTPFALPGIKSLAYVFSDNLNNNIAMQAVAKMPIVIFAPLNPIAFTGECTCIVENTNENNGSAETATLTFQSQVELPEDHPVAFVITDVMDRTYILGAKEAPYPQMRVQGQVRHHRPSDAREHDYQSASDACGDQRRC